MNFPPFFVIVFVELATVSFLVGKIYLERQVLGENISINPISKNDVVFSNPDTESNLKNFYEYNPNTKIMFSQTWLPLDYTYTATINADGLNERFDYSIEKNPDIFRIITLGDSFTFGAWVKTQENYPERLEDMLNDNSLCKTDQKFDVINLGVEGYDIEFSVYRFKVRGQKYTPDLILWFIKNEDFTEINELIKPKIDQYRKEMISDQALLVQLQSEGNFYPWVQKASQELKEELGKEGVLEYSKKALRRMRDYYRGKLVFITFSGREALKDSRFAILEDFAKERGDTYIYDGLSLSYDKLEDKAHPTGKGYAQIAGEIFNYIKRNQIIPCN